MSYSQIVSKIRNECSWIDPDSMRAHDIGYWAYEIRLARFPGLSASFYAGWDAAMKEHGRTLAESTT